MYYVIFAQDNPNMLKTFVKFARLIWLVFGKLQAEGRLLIAGPNPTGRRLKRNRLNCNCRVQLT